MNKVLVDPAALEEAAKWLEIHSSSSGSAEAFAAEALREAIAQPAEAEGVDVHKIVVDSLVGMIAGVTRMIPPADQPLPDFIQAPVDRAVERINAALSAVTAERDRLESMLIQTTARHFAQERKDHADDKKLDECLSEGIAMLEAERDQLRAEVELLRAFVTDCTETAGGMVNGNRLSHRAKELIAAMAAKEA